MTLITNAQNNSPQTQGFTLVEILVSVAIFVVLMTFTLGSVLGILGAGDKSKSLNSVMTNLNFTVEVMSREMKFGTNFYCTQPTDVPPLPPVPTTQNCTGVGLAPQSAISFVTSDGIATVYKLDTNLRQIKKSTDGGISFVGVTAPEVNIQDLKFYVFNSPPQTSLPADNAQPRVTLFIRGYAGTKLSAQSSFALQSTISQRSLDVAPVTIVAAPSNSVYTYCTDEGGICTFSGIATVRYGASGSYTYQSNVNGSIACTNAVFGDPIVGTAKSCYYTITAVSTPSDSVWVEDSVPSGATAASDGGDSWNWVSSSPAPFSGSLSSQSNTASGEHQHYFNNASPTFLINVGDKLVAYVYLDPTNPPSEVMLQWNESGSWEHRAYWGGNSIPWGNDGTISRMYMGSLPATGQWVRLEVPASTVGLEGSSINGIAFTLYDGKATWDHVGKNP